MASRGKRAGSRRAPATRPSLGRGTLLICAGITACVIAWGFLVYAAIEFGVTARTGETPAWGFMTLAGVGAMACLFFGLMLGSLLLEKLGIIRADDESAGTDEASGSPTPPRSPGGKRAAR
ncbi:MAG: hypothetical protein ACI379_11925 [Nocardioides sp.]|uniref:hypothetical protein n=1 Tax=Nocardioides sp. TaxID=35761 RepID=UPI003EFD0B1C